MSIAINSNTVSSDKMIHAFNSISQCFETIIVVISEIKAITHPIMTPVREKITLWAFARGTVTFNTRLNFSANLNRFIK